MRPNARHRVVFGLAFTAVAVGAAAGLTGCGSHTPVSAASTTTTENSTTTAYAVAAPQPSIEAHSASPTTTLAPITTTTTSTVPAHPSEVTINQAGSSSATTPSFTVGSTWTLAYLVDCSTTADGGSFKVLLDGSKPVAGTAYTGDSTSGADVPMTQAGTFTLGIQSNCSWQVQVIKPKPT